MRTAVSRVHARHITKLVRVICIPLSSQLTIVSVFLYQTSSARLMRVLGFTCVYCHPLTGAGPDDTTAQINTFHWHVVDSQSFPLVIPYFTDIAEKGAYGVSAVYTPEDVADIVSYAGGVRPPRVSCRFCKKA